MFNSIDGALAIKCIKEPKEEWVNVVKSSYQEFVNDTNKDVNGVILINEARMTVPSDQKDLPKVFHYMQTTGSLEGCPYVEVKDVVICNYTLRDLSSKMMIVSVIETKDGRTFEQYDIPHTDQMTGRLVDICQSIFYNNNCDIITD